MLGWFYSWKPDRALNPQYAATKKTPAKPPAKRGRDAKTGEFIPVDEAKRRKGTAIVETVKPKKK